MACVLISLVWLASGWWLATLRVARVYTFWQTDIRNGCFVYVWGRISAPDTRGPRAGVYPLRELIGLRSGEWYTTFAQRTRTSGLGDVVNDISIPLWAPFVVVAGPTIWLWWRGRRRFGPGQCGRCGYVMGGLPAEARCPECGGANGRTSADGRMS